MNPSRRTHGQAEPFVTLDGSLIRELVHPNQGMAQAQSLAEATVPAGATTTLHRHRLTEELYHVLRGRGLMELDGARFEVTVGDTVVIRPGTAHCIHNPGVEDLVFLCCCAPAYADADTELLG
ncbi:MAG: cupin domain-containing protein [Pseudomonadales bacterium]|jgi:mannose-6-phosphate isomerase-like protein (cupin superfamily)|nr:cupin domain-containing protein [Pseudomonadales bacterium]